MAITEGQVNQALSAVIDPDLHRDIVSLGFVKQIEIIGDSVAVTIELTTPACPVKDILQQQATDAIRNIEGVDEVVVNMTARVRSRETLADDLLKSVKQVIAIASGKGGVGKSTVTVNLAAALAQQGARVGILDADVYGPSIPLMMGVEGSRPQTANSKLIPIERFGVGLMSLGFLLEPGQVVMWRGPMVAATVKQLLADVAWGELDYLLVDLPPGTGDAPMSLAQLVPLSGVVLVTTPHSVAANIAGKAAALFRRLNTPILGVIENMAGYVCSHCGVEQRLFAGCTGEELASDLSVAYLGSVPMEIHLSESAELGIPVMVHAPDSISAKRFEALASRLAADVSIRAESAQLVN